MKQILPILFFLISSFYGNAQSCTGSTISDVELTLGSTAGMFSFPDIGGGDIINGGNLSSGPLLFDVFDEANAMLGTDGISDITINIEMSPTFDPYGGIIETTTSGTHEVDQSTSGVRGTIAMGTSGATDATTGDVRCYSVRMQLEPTLSISAADFSVLLNSVNTTGEAYESTSVIFLDKTGNPFGTANYTGYYSSPPTGVPGGSNPPTVAASPWATTGTGVYIGANNTVDISDVFNPVSGSSSPLDGFDPNAATDGGLSPGTLVGGMIYTVCLEDVAATLNDGDITTTSTSFTSTINGLSFANLCFGDILLATELNDFGLQDENCAASINWTTNSEASLDYFELERSNDGVSYRTIHTVSSFGSDIQGSSYQFLDKHKGNIAYYRLKMVNTDETATYSDVIAHRSTCESMALYPIPAKSTLTLALQVNTSQEIEIEIFSPLGQKVLYLNESLLRGQNEVQIPVNELEHGVYFLLVIVDGEVLNRKTFIKK